MLVLIAFAFLAGILTVLSPCILPVLPAILAGGTVQGRARPLGITLGLILSFAFFTLALTALVHATGISANLLRTIAITLLACFGLIMIFPKLSNWFSELTAPIAKVGQKAQIRGGEGFVGGLLFGIPLGLLWTPCAGPILAAITTLVATQQLNTTIVLMTLAYSLGAGLPMFLIAYGGSRIVHSSRLLSQHAEGIRQAFGVLILLSAVAMTLHWDMILQQQISTVIPPILLEDNTLVKQELDKLRSTNQSDSIISHAIPDVVANFGPPPEFTGITNWINSPPLSMAQLKGKVVLVDFWTYSCINCLRTLPYLEKWYADYKDKGFIIIGVHTPEFEFEKDAQNVASAAMRLGVHYPIAQDNDYATWNAYHNQYWPAHYLIDQQGNVRLVHFGEGKYVDTENAIRALLDLPVIQMEEAKVLHQIVTPETYLGYLRGSSNYSKEITLKPNETASYTYQKPLDDDQTGIKGLWKVEGQKITAEGSDSILDLNFLAKQVYLVLSGSSKTPLEVVLDGETKALITVDSDRKYDIVETSYGRHLLSLKIPAGISAYAFTFGDEP